MGNGESCVGDREKGKGKRADEMYLKLAEERFKLHAQALQAANSPSCNQ